MKIGWTTWAIYGSSLKSVNTLYDTKGSNNQVVRVARLQTDCSKNTFKKQASTWQEHEPFQNIKDKKGPNPTRTADSRSTGALKPLSKTV
jgi:hypothetical protein